MLWLLFLFFALTETLKGCSFQQYRYLPICISCLPVMRVHAVDLYRSLCWWMELSLFPPGRLSRSRLLLKSRRRKRAVEEGLASQYIAGSRVDAALSGAKLFLSSERWISLFLSLFVLTYARPEDRKKVHSFFFFLFIFAVFFSYFYNLPLSLFFFCFVLNF